jgi:hypothetical protein
VLDDEQRVAGGFQTIQRLQQCFGVRRMQSGRRLVEHVHDAEQIRAHLRRQAEPLQFARRQRGRAPLERQVSESEVEEHLETRGQVACDAVDDELVRLVVPLAGSTAAAHAIGLARMRIMRQHRTGAVAPPRMIAVLRVRIDDRGELLQGHARDLRDIEACEFHRQRLAAQTFPAAHRTIRAEHVPRYPLLHERTLRVRERVQHIAPRAAERAHVPRFLFAPERRARFFGGVTGIDRNGRRLIGEEDPIAVFPRQRLPRPVDVMAERDQDVA